MDSFEFFFSFYSLLLGLAAVEILSHLSGLVRARALHRIDIYSALLASLIFLVICATWIDAWAMRDSFRLTFSALTAPVVIATVYYLAASVVLPKDTAEFADIGGYLEGRRSFVALMMLIGELGVKVTYVPYFAEILRSRPDHFWSASLPANTTIVLLWVSMIVLPRGRLLLLAIVAQIVIFFSSYWLGIG